MVGLRNVSAIAIDRVLFLCPSSDLSRLHMHSEIVQCRYQEIINKNVPIYDVKEANLRGVTTTEKDKKRGVDRFPPP